MYQFSLSDLRLFAKSWVDKYDPHSDDGYAVERMVQQLERVFTAASEPLTK